MPSFIFTAFLAGSVISSVTAFDANSKTNVVTYWGQGPNQQRLLETCKISGVDVINIGFVNQFPDQTGNGYPGTNFGNACWGDVYQNSTGADTQLLKTCPNIGPDVIACQQTYGKKILISLGGGYPTSYYLKSDDSGRALADFLWKAWGPVQSGYTGPRPWGNAVVDGFDFDIENIISPAPSANTNYQTSGYVAMVIYMKNTLFSQDTSKKYYLSGAPQCVLPDAHFTNIINNAWFDFLFIQFYNTQQCSARAGITKQDQGGKPTDDITYGNWTLAKSLNTNIKMYIGLPAAPKAAIADSYYLNLAELQRTVQRFYSNGKFGGVMLWEATYAMGNSICNKEYISWTKNILNAVAAGQTLSTTCPTTTSSISSTTKPSTTSSKTTTTPSRAARAATSSGKKRAARDEPTVHTFRTVVLPEITATPDREAESIA